MPSQVDFGGHQLLLDALAQILIPAARALEKHLVS